MFNSHVGAAAVGAGTAGKEPNMCGKNAATSRAEMLCTRLSSARGSYQLKASLAVISQVRRR